MMIGFRTVWWYGGLWSACVGFLLLLATLRTATDAEVTITSAALLPVLVAAWFGGRTSGFVIANLAVGMWLLLDLASDRPFSAVWVPWGNLVARFVVYNLVALLAAQVRGQFECEHQHATLDDLTGLNNRRAFLEECFREAERSRRYLRPLTVIFLDLDNFKALNDSQGHEVGDLALQVTAEAMRDSVRFCDYVARLGGDEFAVLLVEIDYLPALSVGHKISAAVTGRLSKFPPVTASLGVAWFSQALQPFSTMIQAADELMYEVKKNGKGAVRSRRF